MIKELIHHLHVAENIDIPSDFHLVTPVYNTVLHSLVEVKEVSAFLDRVKMAYTYCLENMFYFKSF